MKRYRSISVFGLAAALALPAAAASGRAVITNAQVAEAISGSGMTVSAEQVTLLTDVVAATSSPMLKVQSMEPWGDRRMKVRLNCTNSEDCLPFIVSVRCSQECGTQSDGANSDRALSTARARLGSNSYTVRAGAPATLLLDGGHVHIRLSVICLENGVPGQTIRVASKDRKQTYTALVAEGAVLRGSL